MTHNLVSLVSSSTRADASSSMNCKHTALFCCSSLTRLNHTGAWERGGGRGGGRREGRRGGGGRREGRRGEEGGEEEGKRGGWGGGGGGGGREEVEGVERNELKRNSWLVEANMYMYTHTNI